MFWDKLKPSTKEPLPVSIDVEAGAIVVAWQDGKTSHIPARRLRLDCPCASCVDEWTGAKRIRSEDLPQEVRPVAMEVVGNYAVQIRWNDGHETGIYSWERLRRYGPEEPDAT